MIIIFFDIESTGTSIEKDRIISLSAIKVEYDGMLFKLLETRNILVNPEILIPKEASEVHGIYNEHVSLKLKFLDYAQQVFEFFNNCDAYGGYNIKKFDLPLLEKEFSRSKIEFNFTEKQIIDCFEIFIKNEKRDLTAALKFYTGQTMSGAHDAENDNMATIKILQGQLFYYGITLNDAINLCKPEDNYVDFAGKVILIDGVPCYSFGKWQGKPVKEHIDYGEWILTGDFPINTKNVIRSLIYGNKN